MEVLLYILKTGEYIISHQYYKEENKVYLKNPKIVVATNTQKDTDDESQLQTSVVLLTWPQFTTDENVGISIDSLISVVNPIEQLKNLYLQSLK